jgi:signal transduction histidine kinase
VGAVVRSNSSPSLRTRAALFVGASVFAGAAVLFTVTVIASRSWVGSEQRSLLVAHAREHARLLENVVDDPSRLDQILTSLLPSAIAAVEIEGRWYGAPRTRFGDGPEGGITGFDYVADATDSESLVILPIELAIGTTAGTSMGRLFLLADHAQWDARRTRTGRLVVVSAILLAVVAAGAGSIAGRRLSRPLAEAAAAARKVGAGRLETRLPESEDPALADLIETFNEMVETVAARAAADQRFNSDVSHELRSPLTTLMASLAVMQSRRHELSPANQTALDLLDADLHRFARLVDDLLEMSRFDANVAALVTSRVNLNEFLEEVVKSSGQSDINLVVSPMARVFEIELDKRRMARALANLLDNAFRHGAPPIWLTAIEIPPGDVKPSHVKISVEDRGPGVDLDRSEELFERFNRGPRLSRSDGSGLGLALTREHVRLHGGSVAFEPVSRGTTGTCITVVLPLRAPDSDG